MSFQQTLCIIKPDAVQAQLTGKILQQIEQTGFKIVALKKIHLSKKEAETFYAVHQSRPFFQDLTTFLSSAPVVVAVLQASDAIQRYRTLMGATNPQQAAPGTLRAQFATSIDHNAVHGSDAEQTAREEIAFFFKSNELFS